MRHLATSLLRLCLGPCLLAGAIGCATAQPFVLSNEQRSHFRQVVREAEAAGALDGPPEAAQHLADAKSDFDYAQHLPRYPERARDLVTKAQAEGELALALARQHRSNLVVVETATSTPPADAPDNAPPAPATAAK